MRRLSREEMLRDITETVARRSTCCRKNVGAILARDGRVLSIGYNGAPSGLPHCTPETCNTHQPCTRTIHAEANAIAFAARAGISVLNSTLYVTVSPCIDCAKLLINSGIVAVRYGEGYRDTDPLELLRSVGIHTECYR